MAKERPDKQDGPAPEILPLTGKILVKPLESEGKAPSDIVLPGSAEEQHQKGTVVAVGPGKLLEDGSRAEPQVSPGDRIVFSGYTGTDVRLEDEEFKLLHKSDILDILGWDQALSARGLLPSPDSVTIQSDLRWGPMRGPHARKAFAITGVGFVDAVGQLWKLAFHH